MSSETNQKEIKMKKGFEIALQIGVLIGRAIAKKPELEKEWKEVQVAVAKAKSEESPGGTRVTLGEIFNENGIAKELLDVIREISPTIDSLIELFDKKED